METKKCVNIISNCSGAEDRNRMQVRVFMEEYVRRGCLFAAAEQTVGCCKSGADVTGAASWTSKSGAASWASGKQRGQGAR